MVAPTGAYTDVVELCALLQFLGFSVKRLTPGAGHRSQAGGMRSITINCQASGLNVVLESGSPGCSCPREVTLGQLRGPSAGGGQPDQTFGRSLLESLLEAPRAAPGPAPGPGERGEAGEAGDGLEMRGMPGARHSITRAETPAGSRALAAPVAGPPPPPPPPPAQPRITLDLIDTSADDVVQDNKAKYSRQGTFTLRSPDSVKNRNKTSSPIRPENVMLESLVVAEKAAEELRHKLSEIIRRFGEEGRGESSESSLAVDVSQISIVKGTEPMRAPVDATTPAAGGGGGGGAASKRRRVSPSPNCLKSNRDDLAGKTEKPKVQDNKNSKLQGIFKPKPGTPTFKSESTPSFSSLTKKRFSHIKSTIPRPSPAPKKE